MSNWLVKIAYFTLFPFAVSLLTYILYGITPGRSGSFYLISAGLAFVIGTLVGVKIFKLPRIKISDPRFKIEWLLIATVIIWTGIRTALYPPTWGDVFEYLQQGYVYSQDRSLARFGTSEPFLPDNSYYVMNTAIQPGIPMLYSLFFLIGEPTPLKVQLTHWLYFYYFCLLLVTIYNLGLEVGLNKKRRYLPLLIMLGCFYLVRFTILGGKEIILMQLSLLALMSLYQLTLDKLKTDWRILLILCASLGIASFINLNGTIIAGIIGLLMVIWLPYRFYRRITVSALSVVLVLIFSAGEPIRAFSKFILNPALIQSKLVSTNAKWLEDTELKNYKLTGENDQYVSAELPFNLKIRIDQTKWNVYWKGKLQSLTQIQFFGFIYILFVLILILSIIKKMQWNRFEKLLLSYIGLYFFLIIDPFSLNPHQYAYVLSISPKYSLMLLPMIAILVAGKHKTLETLANKIPYQKVLLITLPCTVWLWPGAREWTAGQLLDIFSQLSVLTAEPSYYLNIFSRLLLLLATTVVIMVFMIRKTESWIRLLWVGILLFPTLFLMESNFSATKTISYLFSSWEDKLTYGEVLADNREAFELLRYLNHELPTNKTIILLHDDNRLPFYTVNKPHLRFPANVFTDLHLAEHIASGEIKPEYFVYTQAEENSPVLKARPSREIERVGPYIIKKAIYE